MPHLLSEAPASLDPDRALDTGEHRPESMRRALQPLEDSRQEPVVLDRRKRAVKPRCGFHRREPRTLKFMTATSLRDRSAPRGAPAGTTRTASLPSAAASPAGRPANRGC